MIYIHNINPVALNIFNLNIYWYSLAYIFAFLVGGMYAKKILVTKDVSFKSIHVDEFISYSIVGVILGGRIGYVLFYNIDFYFQNFLEIFKIWKGGMSFHGGLIGMIASIILFSNRKKISFFDISNVVACCAPIGLFFGRLANFVNSELYGKPTNGSWGVIFGKVDQIPRHPSQLYEAFFEGFILFLLLIIISQKSNLKDNSCCAFFLIFYGSSRFVIEFFRLPDLHIGYMFNNITTGQLLCLPMVLIGFYVYKK